ncbi:fused MFS/spermidine synthase, partial [candidate division KSB1 bacterium]|nr:fused MFS/spermidine synthase [candidate division KSB1 bacterium]
MQKGYLYFVVGLSGAAVLAIEILGTRILGPFYGVSLFLWSALITVTLAALSVGYALGGWWADRGATVLRLNFLLLAAGGWLVLVPWLKLYLVNLAEPFGLRCAVLMAALILFFPPLTLLGIVSPYAIKLRATNLSEIGRTAGNLYAISTVASVGAALLTGFYLIPSIGVNRLTWLLGLALIFSAIGGFVFRRWLKTGLVITAVGLIGSSLFLFLFPTQPANAASGLLFHRQSPYGEIHVVDREDTRYLLIDGAIHTMIQKDTGETLQAYAIALDLSRLFFQKPGEMLLIGLGGGAIAKSYAQNSWRVTAVEIDPVVIEVARNFFH